MHDWDFREILRRLHDKHFVTPFFKITVEPDPRIVGLSAIRISPAGLGLPDRSFYYASHDDPIIIAYKQLIMDVVILMRATKSDASKFAEDIFYYEKRIAEITPHTIDLQNPVNTYNPIPLKELQDTAKSLPLQDILESMFPKAEINEMTEILVSSPDYLTRISEIVSSTDRSLLNNYVVWTLVKSYLPYLPSDFTRAYHMYRAEVHGINEPPKRWEMCIDTVRTFMGLAAEAKLNGQFGIDKRARNVTEEMFERIKTVAQERLQKYTADKDLQKHLMNKMKSLELNVGLPAAVTGDEFLLDYYTDMFVQKNDLFESVGYGKDFQRSVQTKRYKDPHSYYEIVDRLLEEPPRVTYSAALNLVIVPRALLMDPTFEHSYPRSILYGRLGVEIAEAVASSVLPYDSFWTGDFKLLSPFHYTVNQSERTVRYPSRCLTDYVVSSKLCTPEIALNTSLNTLKHIAGVSLAREALQKSLESSEHVHQPALETYEDSALYYMSYAQTKCSLESKQQELLDNYVSFKLSEKSLLYAVWGQDPEFSNSLQCHYNDDQQCSDIF